jgi:hypothetical protein
MLNNFHAVVAIMTGLQTQWVVNAMGKKGWNKVGLWDLRLFSDLQAFSSKVDDFVHIRQTVDQINTFSQDNAKSDPPSADPSGVELPQGGVPFFGKSSITDRCCQILTTVM